MPIYIMLAIISKVQRDADRIIKLELLNFFRKDVSSSELLGSIRGPEFKYGILKRSYKLALF